MKAWHSLEGKSVWVTGGAGYLGSMITEALDAAGVATLCLDLPGKAEALVKLKALSRTIPVSCDVNQVTGLPGLIEKLIQEHGVPDGIVHTAFAASTGKGLDQLTPADFSRSLDANLAPLFILCRSVAEHMRARGSGSIVLFSSMYGVVAPDPRIYQAPLSPNPIEYGASKAAVIQLSRYFSVHYGPSGIRFNCVTPGPFPNPKIQESNPAFISALSSKTVLRRIGQSSEIVGPTLFLLTDGASFVTGHSLLVDGGWTAW